MTASLPPPGTPLFQYWDSAEIPDYIAELTGTFAAHNPELRHRVFSEEAAAELIGEHFGRRELDCFRACAVPAMQADYFRYCAVLACGGVYVDADYRCRGRLWEMLGDDDEAVLLRLAPKPGKVPPTRVQNSFLLFKEPGHPLLELALSMATERIEQLRERDDHQNGFAVLFITGPVIFTGLRFAYELGSLAALADAYAGTRLEKLGLWLCEAIGEHERVERAFRGVRLQPIEECAAVEADMALPYKATDSYWRRWNTNIFRPAT